MPDRRRHITTEVADDSKTPTVQPIGHAANVEQLARIANLLAEATQHADSLQLLYDRVRERRYPMPPSWDNRLRSDYGAFIERCAQNLDALIDSAPK